ncbi:MAG: penicillin-binding protein 2 [Deltaproteobacteria bacterium]|nr:penicillin-binding protein 2 [Deltaproteobacteria bacterium]MBW2600760.1 penicillin-binding protein 2 [Deltaproteobacteria bacterium]
MKIYRKKKTNRTKWIRFRIGVVSIVLALSFGVIIGRAVQLQIFKQTELSQKAISQYKTALHRMPRRGTIYDRNHRELAVSISITSIYAHPKQVLSQKRTATTLARALNLEQQLLSERLSSDKGFVWIKRHATPREVSAIRKLDLDGIDFVAESKRFYPMKTLAAQVIGFCGIDGKGLEGLEYYYNRFLSGQGTKWTVFKDALGRSFNAQKPLTESRNGYNLVLTIDKNIQHITQTALSEAVKKFSAKSGMALVMEPHTGAMLAIAHAPEFNPNIFAQYEPQSRRNRAITDCFEPGSTFKIFLGAAALESGLCTRNTEFDCEDGRYKIGNSVVHDVHSRGVLSLQDIIKYSSNIGAAKIGNRIGEEYLFDRLKAFGFGTRAGIDCPGETPGSVRAPEDWSDMDALAICFGQSVAVSALQLATAVSAIANDGVLMKPYLVQAMTDQNGRIVKAFQPTRIRRVISSETAKTMGLMLERVVAKGGTGQKAALSGYTVAGKTGTAQKVDSQTNRYATDKHIANFVGFVPARDPAIAILVVVDEPRKQCYGGIVAAPVFSQIAKESLQYLKIPPELITPKETDSIRASTETSTWAG